MFKFWHHLWLGDHSFINTNTDIPTSSTSDLIEGIFPLERIYYVVQVSQGFVVLAIWRYFLNILYSHWSFFKGVNYSCLIINIINWPNYIKLCLLWYIFGSFDLLSFQFALLVVARHQITFDLNICFNFIVFHISLWI